MTEPAWWPAGTATGLGPLPGTDVDEAMRSIAGELADLPFVPELAARGVGADPVGRTVALLVDIFGEVVPSGWRISRRPGMDDRRADDFRRWDLDAAGAQAAGATRLKVQLLGPWSLAARLELPSGNLAVGDHGAVADLAGSLAEGLRQHIAELERRIPGLVVSVQLDEPELDRVLAGSIPTASGFGTLRHIPVDTVRGTLAGFVAGLGDRPVIAAAGPAGPLWKLVRAAGFGGLVAGLGDLTGIASSTLDAIGEAVQDGRRLLVALPPGSAVADVGPALTAGWQRIGFAAADLAGVLTPVAVADPAADLAAAVGGMKAAAELGRALQDPPDSWG